MDRVGLSQAVTGYRSSAETLTTAGTARNEQLMTQSEEIGALRGDIQTGAGEYARGRATQLKAEDQKIIDQMLALGGEPVPEPEAPEFLNR